MVDLSEVKAWTQLALTADRLICRVPCFVKHICLTAGTGGAATVLVYNGVDTSGELLLALSSITSTHFNDDFDVPVYFSNGIYVDIGSNVTLFNIHFIEESPA